MTSKRKVSHSQQDASSHSRLDSESGDSSQGPPTNKVARRSKSLATQGDNENQMSLARNQTFVSIINQQIFPNSSVSSPWNLPRAPFASRYSRQKEPGHWMDSDYKQFCANQKSLAEDLTPKDVMPRLISKGIFDMDDKDYVENGGKSMTRLDQAFRLLELIYWKGGDAYKVFLEVLKESGYDQVLEKIKSTDVNSSVSRPLQAGFNSDQLCSVIKPSFFDDAVKIVSQHRRVVIKGRPGCGKTTLGHAILQHFKEDGFHVLTVTHHKELKEITARQTRTIVLLDETLGDVRLDTKMLTVLRAMMPKLSPSGNIYIVCILLPNIYHELELAEERPFRWILKPSVLLNMEKHALSVDDKKAMLKCHFQKLPVQLDESMEIDLIAQILQKDTCGSSFPYFCEKLVELESYESSLSMFYERPEKILRDRTALFTQPALAYIPLLRKMLHDQCYGEVFAAVFALKMQGMKSFQDPKKTVDTLKELGLTRKHSVHILEQTAHYLKGFLLDASGTEFLSPVISQAVGFAMGSSFLLPVLLKVCKFEFIFNFVRVRQTEDISIIVPKENLCFLYQALCQHVGKGAIVEMCQYCCLLDQTFLHDFEAYCDRSEDKLHRRLVNVSDAVHKLPFLYWSAWSPSVSLFDMCLRFTVLESRFNIEDLLFRMLFVCVLAGDGVNDKTLAEIVAKLKALQGTSLPEQELQLVVPFPQRSSVLTPQLQTRCERIHLRFVSGILNQIIPEEVAIFRLVSSASEDVLYVSIRKISLWYFVVRLFDTHSVEQDCNGDTLLHVAVCTKDTHAIRYALEKCGSCILTRNHQGLAPPHMAERNEDIRDDFVQSCLDGDLERVKRLLCQGADIRCVVDGNTPLHNVCMSEKDGNTAIARMLAGLGAEVNVTNSTGQTPLYLACRHGCTSTAAVLIAHGADVNVVDDDKNGPLHVACRHGLTHIVKLLLQNGKANVDLRNEKGMTPLHLGVMHEFLDVVKVLLNNGAKVNILTSLGNSPVQMSAERGDITILQCLFNAGANLNCVNRIGETSLHRAAACGHVSCVSFLLENGASVSPKSNFGYTPFVLAKKGKNRKTIEKLLQSFGAVEEKVSSVCDYM